MNEWLIDCVNDWFSTSAKNILSWWCWWHRSGDWLVDGLNKWLIEWVVDWFITSTKTIMSWLWWWRRSGEWLVGGLNEWLIDWVIDRFSTKRKDYSELVLVAQKRWVAGRWEGLNERLIEWVSDSTSKEVVYSKAFSNKINVSVKQHVWWLMAGLISSKTVQKLFWNKGCIQFLWPISHLKSR